KNINLKISTPLMKFNFLEHKEIKKFAHKLGISAQSDPIILMKNNGNLNPLKLRLNKREWEKFYLENPQELKEIKIINPDKIPCGAGHRMCAVSPYGELYPCPGFRLSAGNLIENNFSSIWKYSKILKDIRGIKNKNLKDCVNCKINSYCSRCPGTAYQEEKNLFAKVKTACQLAEINRNTRKFIK
ncbi:MAG: SPASM domain-containing protein, partial [Armatimonadetes bacterium]|nr:SPASM domain-containing protein [Armatimonadota bacterium]